MKILEINKFNFPNRGADRHYLDLVSLLRSHGHEVAVFAMDNPKNCFSPWKKYFVSYVGYQKDTLKDKFRGIFRMFYSYEAQKKIKRLLDDFQPDIVHIHNIYHQISPSILPEIKRRGIPIVMTVHDYKLISPDYLLGDWENMTGNRYFEFIKKKGFKNSYLASLIVSLEHYVHRYFNLYDKYVDLYISPSKFLKDKLVKNGYAGSKIIVLPHFSFLSCPIDRSLTMIRERYVLYCGSISKSKGIPELISIFEDTPRTKLYLAGTIEPGFDLPKAENVRYLGFLNSKEVDHYIRNSLFAISLSRLPETFGLFALEALKNGRPFIGLGHGAYCEIIENDKEGYICQDVDEAKEKAKRLLSDEGLRILMSRNSLKKSLSFSSESYYKKIIAIFRTLRKPPLA